MGITTSIGFAHMSEKLKYTCHGCHEWMPERLMYGQQTYPIGEWHYCDKCMKKRT